MTKMQELVKDSTWQKVRKNLLGKWSTQPDWCCSELRKYLGSIKTTKSNKLRIVMNYLVGTGFRTGKIKHSCISNLRKEISEELKRRKSEKLAEMLWKGEI